MNLLRIPQTVQNIQRFRQIAAIVAEYGFAEFLIRAGIADRWYVRMLGGREAREAGDPATRFAAMLERLGPSFVKLGQILSTRADLLPEDWIRELGRLQDEVAPVPFAAIRPVVEATTGSLDTAFARFEEAPLASASVGQVHAAVTLAGDEVVVKVIRPGIRELVLSDVEIMRIFAQLLEQRVPELASFRPTGVVDEFERAIVRELDLGREARNIERFRRAFADDDRVYIPGVHRELSSRDILTMERIYGERITDYAKLDNDPVVLASLGVEVILKMAFEDGFFHADPHPGNIWTLPGNRIALLDMGMADFVLPDTRDALVDLMFAVATDDPESMVRAVTDLGSRPDDLDRQAFKRDVMAIYEDHVRGAMLSEINIGEMIGDCIEIARRHHIVIPTDITMLLKGLGTVEGIGKQLNPDLDLVAEARPYVSRLIGLRWGPDRLAKRLIAAAADGFDLAVSLPSRIDGLIEQAERGSLKTRTEVEGLHTAIRQVERGHGRIAVALLVLALTMAGTALWQNPLYSYRGVPVAASVLYLAAGGLGLSVLLVLLREGLRRR